MNRLILPALVMALSACNDADQSGSSVKEANNENLPYSRQLDKASELEGKLQDTVDERLNALDDQDD